ncbi:MAG: hypothetical protein SOV37_04620, partial [Candidatus Borkfalkiaceae bacterium]|nr:hypothetical protein [Christensenellaceae bacterium]
VVRYFADAQYDVRSTIVGFADTLPEGESEISFTVFASVARQTPGRVEVYEVYVAYFFSGIAAPAARNDVPFLRVILNEVKNPTEELTGICTFSLWSWDISLRSI